MCKYAIKRLSTHRTLRPGVAMNDALKFHASHGAAHYSRPRSSTAKISSLRESHRSTAANVKLPRHTGPFRTGTYYLSREIRPRRRVHPRNAESRVPAGDLETGPVRHWATAESLSESRASPRSSVENVSTYLGYSNSNSKNPRTWESFRLLFTIS